LKKTPTPQRHGNELYIPRLTLVLEGTEDRKELEKREKLYEDYAASRGQKIVWCTLTEALMVMLFEAREGDRYEQTQKAFMDGLAEYLSKTPSTDQPASA